MDEPIQDVAVRVFDHLGGNSRAWTDIWRMLDYIHGEEARRRLGDRRNSDLCDIGYQRGVLEVLKTVADLQTRCKGLVKGSV